VTTKTPSLGPFRRGTERGHPEQHEAIHFLEGRAASLDKNEKRKNNQQKCTNVRDFMIKLW
jgi:hypothetical protein